MQQQTPLLANMSVKLTRAEMREILAGAEEDGIECKSTCSTTSDCPTDRFCGSGTCGGIEIKSCFKYP